VIRRWTSGVGKELLLKKIYMLFIKRDNQDRLICLCIKWEDPGERLLNFCLCSLTLTICPATLSYSTIGWNSRGSALVKASYSIFSFLSFPYSSPLLLSVRLRLNPITRQDFGKNERNLIPHPTRRLVFIPLSPGPGPVVRYRRP
jgi:hypothetical protein